jgi:fibronectin-binding autotransporter adhesin
VRTYHRSCRQKRHYHSTSKLWAAIELLEPRRLFSTGGIAPDLETVADAPSPIGSALVPSAIRNWYGFNSISANGSTQAIAIIDWGNDANIVSDLNTFDSQYGISGSGTLTVYAQNSTNGTFQVASSLSSSQLPEDAGLIGNSGEISLDVEWAHALAPGANIDLVESQFSTNNATLDTDIEEAIDYAKTLSLVSVVSMSFGGPDSGVGFPDSVLSQPGVTFVASSGDTGSYQTELPTDTYLGTTTLAVVGPSNIGGTTDSFTPNALILEPGDFTVVAEVQSGTTATQAGLSIRAQTGSYTTANVSLLVNGASPGTGSGTLSSRPSNGVATTNDFSFTTYLSGTYLAIQRQGTNFFAYSSSDALIWYPDGEVAVPNMSGTLLISEVGASNASGTVAANFSGPTLQFPSVALTGGFVFTGYTTAMATANTPASSSNVLGVGGTILTTNGTGNITGTTGMDPTAWGNGVLSAVDSPPFSGSGGGLSSFEQTPAYQGGFNSNTYRAVPDVSFDGGTAVSIFDSDDAYTNGFGQTLSWAAVTGTSIGAPAWAALVSVIDQGRVANGLPVLDSSGNATDPNSIQSLLYNIAANATNYSNDFNDVQTGNNGAYSASNGYDLVTGLGTPQVADLYGTLTAATAIGTVTWTGGGTGNWSTASDWSDDQIPNEFDNVTIGSATVTVSAGSFVANNITLTSSAALNVLGTLSVAGSLTISSGTTLTLGNGGTTGAIGSGGLVDNGTLAFDRTDSGLLVSSVISGSGLIVQNALGTSDLSGNNTGFSGTTSVVRGDLQLGNANALGTAGSVTIGNDGTLDINSKSATLSVLTGGGVIVDSAAGSAMLTVGAGNATSTFSGTINDVPGTLSLVKTGTGTLTLRGENTFSGGTTINGGDLQIDGDAALGNTLGGVVINSGVLEVTFHTTSPASRAFTLGSSSSEILSDFEVYYTIDGNISGTGALNVAGVGTLTLTGSNTYTGGTNAKGGDLVIGSYSALPSNTSLTIGTTSTSGMVALATIGCGLNTLGFINTYDNTSPFTLSGLTINTTNGSTLDIGSNALMIIYGSNPDPVNNITAYLAASCGGASESWNGPGISSTTINAANSIGTLTYAIGYYDGDVKPDYEVRSGDIFIMPTLAGDTKLKGLFRYDGVLDAEGISEELFDHVDEPGSWYDGNFEYEPVIGPGDLMLIDTDATQFADASGLLADPTDPAPQSLTLSIVASGGNYTVYANDPSTNSAGIAAFDIDVVGSNGATVTSSTVDAPTDGTYGFSQYESNGVDGVGIAALQNTPGTSGFVIQGFGQTSGSEAGLTWTQTSYGVEIASGTYSGSGVLSVNVDPYAYIQTLADVSGGEWSGPGNLFNAQVTGGVNIASGTSLDITNGPTLSDDIIDNGSLVLDTFTSLTVSGSISGSGSLVQAGSGTAILVGSNTFTGGTTLENGTLQLGSSASLGNGSVNIESGGTLDLHGNNTSISSLTGTGTVNNLVSGNVTLTVGGTSTNSTFSGTIKNTDGSLSLIEAGSGTLTLSGTNTYYGGTTIESGTLQLGRSGSLSLGFGGLTVESGSTLDLHGHNTSIPSITGSGTIDNLISGNVTLTVGSANTTTTFSGTINNTVGTLNLTEVGVGALTLSGTNTYTGGTNAESGELIINSITALPTNRSLAIGSGTLTATVVLATNASGLEVDGSTYDSTSPYTLSSLTVNTGSKFDIGANAVDIDYSGGTDPISTIQSYLTTGYADGSWVGSGIDSTSVAAENTAQNGSTLYAIGYTDGADGITGLASGWIEILPTISGDAKMQGNVVFGDFQLLSQYFGSAGSWDEGNFHYQPKVNFGDFQALSQDFGSNDYALTSAPGDPSPTYVSLTLVVSNGNWTVYAYDTSTNNVGIESFDINVVGTDGASVTGSSMDAPNSDGYGFNQYGDNGDDGTGITAAESASDGMSGTVIQGFGLTSGSGDGLTWTQTSSGVKIASGTYTGSGTLSVNVADGAYVQTLDIVSGGSWSGPANLCDAQVAGSSVNVETMYVDANATGADNGTSWTNAYTSLQSALAAAATIESGTPTTISIDVAQGTFYPTTNNTAVTNPTATFNVVNGVSIFGGYGGVDNPSNPNSLGFVTTLSGSGTSYHVVTITGSSGTTILDSLTITGGNADGFGTNAKGGGIYDTSKSLSVVDCTVENNYASYGGGGICVEGDGDGNAIGDEGEITIKGCVIEGDSAGAGGAGGIYVRYTCTARIEYSTINNDYALCAAAVGNYGDTTIIDSTMDHDTAYSGGAIYNSTYLAVTGCTLAYDTSTRCGGAIYNFSGKVVLINSTFYEDTTDGAGGAIWSFGNYSQTLQLTDCTITGDSAESGGGVYDNCDNASLYGTIVAENAGGDLAGGTFQGSYNLIGDGSGGLSTADHNILGNSEDIINPDLSSLGNYGGPTETMKLLANSPAIGNGYAFAGVLTDQRGIMRPDTGDPEPDIGAYQT